MKQCPNCDYDNPYEATHCGNCGFKLTNTTLLTRPVSRKTGLLTPLSTADMHDDLHEIIQGVIKENAQPEPSEFLRFEIAGAERPLIIQLRREVVLGRRDPTSPVQPDVNLTPYSGYRMGVSRLHAVITRTPEGKFMLTDLGSSNGTFINNTKLEVRRPYPFNSGDELGLGQMSMQVFLHEPDTP